MYAGGHAHTHETNKIDTLTYGINARNVTAGIRLHGNNAPRINDEGLITEDER